MSAGALVVVVKSPSDQLPTQSIECSPLWTVFDLKEHIASTYASHPVVASQRLIHAGKLLDDKTKIQSLFKQIIHLVCKESCRNDVRQPSETKADDLSKIPINELRQYQEAYYKYLREFYAKNQVTASTQPAGLFYPCLINSDQSGSNQQLYTGHSSMQLNGQSPNEINNQPPIQPAQPQEENQPARMVGGRFDMNGGEDNADIIDRVYSLLRFMIFLFICASYTSLDKAIMVVSVAAFIYFFNIFRRHVAHRPAPVMVPDERNVLPDGAEPPAAVEAEQEISQRRNNTDNEVEADPPIHAAPTRLNQLRSYIISAVHILSTFITSLIPEPHPMRLD